MSEDEKQFTAKELADEYLQGFKDGYHAAQEELIMEHVGSGAEVV